jgi:4-hydroxythreonine-4-phosphate dehydrogenase
MKKRIIFTIGDPNGIGPEIILKIFNSPLSKKFFFKVVGPGKIFNYYSKLLRLKNLNPENLLNIKDYETFKTVPGKISPLAGRIAGDAVRLASDLCMHEEYEALVTLPLSKESLNLGGYEFPGHTEMLEYYTGSKEVLMIMHSPELIIANATNHIPVKKLSRIINKSFIKKKLILLNNILVSELKIFKPSIAVLSFNPHNGDGGKISNEEQISVVPAIEELKSEGLNISGTFAADSYFGNKIYKKFNVTLALFHDQGLIPFKMLAGKNGVNFTGGLKIVRTSPDHGTAFDISGKGIAEISSTIAAIKLASKIIDAQSK